MRLKDRVRTDLANFSRMRKTGGLRLAVRRTGQVLRNRLTGMENVPLAPHHPGVSISSRWFSGPVWRDLAEREVFFGRSPEQAGLARRFLTVGDLNLPQCFRYRVQQLGEVFGPENYDYSHYQDIPRAIRLMQTATDVIFYRVPMGAPLIEALYEARRLGLRVWYDIDDPLFSVSDYATYSNFEYFTSTERQHFLDEAPSYLAAISACDAVTVSTEALAESLRRLTDRPVYVRRNFLDDETIRLADAMETSVNLADDPGPMVVTISSASRGRIGDLKPFLPALAAALKAEPSIEIRFFGTFEKEVSRALASPRVRFEKPSDYNRYLSMLARSSVHLVLLSDDGFNACKSAIRFLEASAVGVPVIATPIGDVKAISDGGVIEYVATPAELTAALSKFASDRTALSNLGARAHDHARANWTGENIHNIADAELVDAWGLTR